MASRRLPVRPCEAGGAGRVLPPTYTTVYNLPAIITTSDGVSFRAEHEGHVFLSSRNPALVQA